MVRQRIYNDEKHVQLVTFFCDRRRNRIQHDQAKPIVIGQFGCRLAKRNGLCTGDLVTPTIVQALIWFPE